MKRDCLKLKRKLESQSKTDHDIQVEKVSIANSNKLNKESFSSWYLDSGATSHMCSFSSLFSSLQPVSDVVVYLANGSPVPVKGIGNILLYNEQNRKRFLLKRVLYVPELQLNLISVNGLLRQNFC